MNVLFVGDSITKGSLGESFVQLLQKDFPHHCFTNLGLNGDTFLHIAERLELALHQKNNYDWVFIQAGYVDVILPLFKQKGRLFQAAYKHKIKQGLLPILSEEEFELALKHIIIETQKKCTGRIGLFTIGCINEFQKCRHNEKRMAFNAIIRQVAKEEDITLVDVASAMENQLAVLPQTSYFLQSFCAVTLTDYILGRWRGWNFLSRKRGLQLTIDGVHLNTRSAVLFKELVKEILQKPIEQSIKDKSLKHHPKMDYLFP